MLHEGRGNERKALYLVEQITSFFIESNGRRHPFDKVKDVSVSGAGIQLPFALAPSSAVIMGFEQGNYEVRVQGTVMWCKSLEENPDQGHDDCYRMGIRFNPHDLKNSSMLFLALREFIDPFGSNQ